MRKQELIHVHRLLAEIVTYCEREDGLPLDLTEYESLGVHPPSIHRSKGEHQEAVFALTEAITAACRGEGTERAVGSTRAEAD